MTSRDCGRILTGCRIGGVWSRGGVSPHQNRQNRQWSRWARCRSCFSRANVCCHCDWQETTRTAKTVKTAKSVKRYTPPRPHPPFAAFRDFNWTLPDGNKRCFLNGGFQSGVFRGWRGCARAQGTNMPENTGALGHGVTLKRFTSVASRGEESEKHRLENTVWL